MGSCRGATPWWRTRFFAEAAPNTNGGLYVCLWTLRAAHPPGFDVILLAAQAQPHIPLLFLRGYFGASLDAVFFGPASPPLFSWPLALLLPGVLCARYAARFYEGSPLLSAVLIASFVMADVGLWHGVAATARASVRSSLLSWQVVRRMLAPWAFVALYAAASGALWGVTWATPNAQVLLFACPFLYNHAVATVALALWYRLLLARGARDAS